MSKTFVYERFDCTNGRAQHCYGCYQMEASSDGDYVRAEDAINREAVLQAEIRALQVQSKDARITTIERCAKLMNPFDDEGTLGALNAATIRALKEQIEC